MKTIDLTLYGATGFTGQLVLAYLNQNAPQKTIAIAGRDPDKLSLINAKLNGTFKIMVAKANDRSALDTITKRSKIILNTAGPFHRLGTHIIESCIANQCHYLDITGETFWVQDLIQKFHHQAQRHAVRLIPFCGFDSVPSDLLTLYAAMTLHRPIKTIDLYHSFKGQWSGGTMETIFSIRNSHRTPATRHPFALNPPMTFTKSQLIRSKTSKKIQSIPSLNGWSTPFMMAAINTKVVRRSHALMAQNLQSYGDDFVYREHQLHPSWLSAMGSQLQGMFLAALMHPTIQPWSRRLFPKPGEGPTAAVQQSGWSRCHAMVECADGTTAHFEWFADGDPGYSTTAKIVSECALCLLDHLPDCPGGEGYGGILTPATGLGIAAIERLQSVGIILTQRAHQSSL